MPGDKEKTQPKNTKENPYTSEKTNEIELFELTTPQKNIWSIDQYYNNTSINNVCGTVIIHEKTNAQVLQTAVNVFVRICDAFGLQLLNENNTIKQYFDNNIATNYYAQIYKLENKDELTQLENESSHLIFDSNKLFDIKVFKLKNGEGGLVYSIHHILSDSWSIGLAYNFILKIYYDLLNNSSIPQKKYNENNFNELQDFIKEEKEKLAVGSYKDFIAKEHDYMTGNAFEKDKKYWNDLFNTIPEIPQFSQFNKKNNNSNSATACRKEFTVSRQIVDKMNDFCKKNRISIYNFLMSVYSVYISNISNLNDFVIGTPILNRSNHVEKNTVGMFVSTIPMRINVDDNISFSEFSQNTAKNTFSTFRHQHYPYECLLRDLRTNKKDVPNLYNTILSYQITTNVDKNFSTETYWNFNGNSSDELQIHIVDYNDTGALSILYDHRNDKYETDDINNIHKRILFIIEQIINKPEILINEIEVITSDEKNKIDDFNKTNVDYPKNKTISMLFEEQAKKTPNNIALVFENERLTYKELNEKANSLARFLRKSGIKKNDLVGIMCNRSMEIIVSILAVLKAGGTYIPIDPTYPKDRIDYMLQSSKAKVLLTQKALAELVNYDNKLFIDLANEDIYKNNDKSNLKNENSPQDLAYVIFTSGSTGKPKGVMLQHNNVVNFILDISKKLEMSSNDTVVSITTFSFDMFVLEGIVPLANGSTIVIANEKEQNNVDLFNKLCIKNNVNVFNTSPSRMQSLTSNSEYSEFVKNATKIFIGGEPLQLAFLEKLKKITKARIYNLYGPTETAVYSTIKEQTNDSNINVGKPIANTQIYILNNKLKMVPFGFSGEIYIAGQGVCRGYLNNKELTEKSFIKNPYNKGIIYKTGDLGYINQDGNLVCLGRSDSQVKIRGLRIELGEIEEILSKHNSIKSCAVVKRTDSKNREALCAYYTSDENIETLVLKKYLETFLPKYMIPQYFTKMEELPHTPNGKIDRRALPEPEIKSSISEIVLPRNNTEFKLVNMYKDILNIDNVSIEDSFFDIGGDSLSAINLSAQIQSELNAQLFVKDIMENPTVRQLSDLILKGNNSIKAIEIKKIKKAEFYEVSSAQKRMYFASQSTGNDSTVYNIPGGVIIDGILDVEKLEKCLNIIVKRHETLRTYFEMYEARVVQKIVDELQFNFDVIENIDYKDLNSIFKEFVKPFDLSKAPLFRVEYLKFTNKKSALFFDAHHIICDGTSIAVFVDELCKLYNGETLPDLEITYKDFAQYEIDNLSSKKLEEAKEYWLNRFKGEIPVLNMPTNYTRTADISFEGKKVYSSIGEEDVNKIERVCKELQITPYMLLLSAYYIMLYKYTSQNDIIVGSPVVSRDIKSTYNLIGMFVNTLPLRESIDGNITFKDFALSLKNDLLDAYKYQTYPLDELVNNLDLKRNSSKNPLFDTLFTYQNNGLKSFNFEDFKFKYYVPDTGISKFDLSLEISHNNNNMQLSYEYSTKLFNKSFINNLSNHYLNIVKKVLENVDSKIADIDMLSEKEINKIENEFNNTKLEYPTDKTIYELFEEQAQKTPNNIAIAFEDQTITYKELNIKVNRLANQIKNEKLFNKITKEKTKIIGIMLNRRPEIIVSMLAILKLGCAYLPIDPTYPDERIEYIINDSKINLILTEEQLMWKFNSKSNETGRLSKIKTILVDDKNNYTNKEKVETLAKPDDLAYLIYTSGSTGNPKGVMITQKNVVNFIFAMQKKLPIKNDSSIVSITTMCFDIFVLESLMPVCLGMKVVLANNDEQNSPILLNELCKKNDVNVIQTTPSKFSFLISDESNLDFIKNMKLILLGGEAFPSALLNTITKYSKSKIFNMYGPTETTVWSSVKELTHEKQITIGKPIGNTKIYVLDNDLNEVPINVPGKIFIGGDGVTKGYLNREELTSEKFIEYNGNIVYDTGDLGKLNSNKEIEYLGRTDFQVKFRGLRIELGEIEKAISSYKLINNSVVTLKNINGRNVLCGYFISDGRISISLLRNRLIKKLPNYMVPTYLMQVKNFEYTPNGKIDRNKLLIPSISSKEIVLPETPLQRRLLVIWKNILSIEQISVNDNFFEIGGDSLSALKLQLELMKINININYADIFANNTIQTMCSFIENHSKTEETHIKYKKIEFFKINRLLRKNRINKLELKQKEIKNVLLLGSTGFLGVHVLAELLKIDNIKIYCIIREDPSTSATIKLKNKLNYYYGNDLSSLFDDRINVISGEISNEYFGLSEYQYKLLATNINTVINCAALVKHYGEYELFEKANVTSVKNMIEFCEEYGKDLVHISTLSVAGNDLLDFKSKENHNNKKIQQYGEDKLYIGQNLDNVYVRSKFEAEKIMLKELANKKLRGIILRVGNITNRYIDGKFQENVNENAFHNRLKAFISLREVPNSILEGYLEFTPVDILAQSIIQSTKYYTQNTSILHLYNYNHIDIKEFINITNSLGIKIKEVEDDIFKSNFKNMLFNSPNFDKVSVLLNDMDDNFNISYNQNTIITNKLSKEFLTKIGFEWPQITKEYIKKVINNL